MFTSRVFSILVVMLMSIPAFADCLSDYSLHIAEREGSLSQEQKDTFLKMAVSSYAGGALGTASGILVSGGIAPAALPLATVGVAGGAITSEQAALWDEYTDIESKKLVLAVIAQAKIGDGLELRKFISDIQSRAQAQNSKSIIAVVNELNESKALCTQEPQNWQQSLELVLGRLK